MDEPVLKAFVLCDEISDSASGSGQKDLRGAGLSVIRAYGEFPIKRTFWVYIQIADQKSDGTIQLVLTRADSGRSHPFRIINVTNPDRLIAMVFDIRLFECILPLPGVYFLEFWYDGVWLLDQRFEVVQGEGD
jgi:hypothetical protein